MSIYNHNLHHHTKIRQGLLSKLGIFSDRSGLIKTYDKFIYLIVFICPLINLPQLYKVWFDENSSGVSAFAWLGFAIVSLMWFIYGILHKDKHLIIMNMLLFVLQLAIGVGATIN